MVLNICHVISLLYKTNTLHLILKTTYEILLPSNYLITIRRM